MYQFKWTNIIENDNLKKYSNADVMLIKIILCVKFDHQLYETLESYFAINYLCSVGLGEVCFFKRDSIIPSILV